MSGVSVSRRLRPWTWAAAAVLLVALVVWRGVEWDTGGSPGPGSATDTGDASVGLDMYPRGDRPEAPQLEGRTLDGTPFKLAEYAGKVVVINVWGSWCGPCQAETPDLVRVARKSAGQGVRFVGIDTRDNLAAAQSFTRKYNVPYPSIFDSDGRALLPFRGITVISAVPSTVVVDRDGTVAARVIGPVTYKTLSGLLEDIAGRR